MKKCIIWALAMSFLASCVSNKKLQYLQNNDVNIDEVTLNTMVRGYQILPGSYKIQPEDLLSIRVQSLSPEQYNIFSGGDQGSFSGNLTEANAVLIGELIDENGEIEFPSIGKVKVAGLTIFEAERHLQTIAEHYLEDPIVKIRLLNFRFTLLGEVKREGTVTNYNNRVTLLEAIGLAGGLTDLADRSKIKLIRTRGANVEVIYINLLDETIIDSPYYFISQNDVLVVPALKQQAFRRYFGQNFSLIVSSASLLILVLSTVNFK